MASGSPVCGRSATRPVFRNSLDSVCARGCTAFLGGGIVRFLLPEKPEDFHAIELLDEVYATNVFGDAGAALSFHVKDAIGQLKITTRCRELGLA